MKHSAAQQRPIWRKLSLVLLLCALSSLPIRAQLWNGILSPTRAVDWSGAGVQGGIPSGAWTQCGPTITAYTGSGATITNALAHSGAYSGCGDNTYVLLADGTYVLSSGIVISLKKSALRGTSASGTIISFSAGASSAACGGTSNSICFASDITYQNSQFAVGVNITGGLSQGSYVIQLASVAGITSDGTTMVHVTQCEDGDSGTPCSGLFQAARGVPAIDNGNFFAEDTQYVSNANGTGNNYGGSVNGMDLGNQPYNRPQTQMDLVAAICIGFGTSDHQSNPQSVNCVNPNQIILTEPLAAPNWSLSRSPQVFIYHPKPFMGLENLTVDNSNVNRSAILLQGAANSWVYRVRIKNPGYSGFWRYNSTHNTIDQNYSFGIYNNNFGPDCFGVNGTSSAFDLIQSNIIQTCKASLGNEGSDTGSVYAYNTLLFNYNNSNGIQCGIVPHAVDEYQLYEGNYFNCAFEENYHGPKIGNTFFRNHAVGWTNGANFALWGGTAQYQQSSGSGTTPMRMMAYSRYHNILSNVLGTPGFSNTYSGTNAFQGQSIYEIGSGNGGVAYAPPIQNLVRHLNVVTATLLASQPLDVSGGNGGTIVVSRTGASACAGDDSFLGSFTLVSGTGTSTLTWNQTGAEVAGDTTKTCKVGQTIPIPVDTITARSLMRWNNWDTATNATRNCGLGATGFASAPCSNVSEVPTVAAGETVYPNLIPTAGDTTVMPPSFYLAAKPSFFKNIPWPAIGPDVTLGNMGICNGQVNPPVAGTYANVPAQTNAQCPGTAKIAAFGNHVNAIPSLDCFLNKMNGPVDGSNATILSFDPAACYDTALTNMTISPLSFNFGPIAKNTNFSVTFTVTNPTVTTATLTGDSPFTACGLYCSDFSLSADTCNSGTVAASGGTCAVTVTINGTAPGGTIETATLNIGFTGPSGSPLSAVITAQVGSGGVPNNNSIMTARIY